MADIETPVTAPVTPAAPVADSAVSSAPVTTTESIVTTPTSTPAASVEAAPSSVEVKSEPAKTETPVVETSLLAAEPPVDAKAEVKPETKVEAKPEEKKPEAKAEEKPAEVKTEEAPLPTYEPCKLPDTFKGDEKTMGDLAGLLGKLELAKGDHKATQEIGQKIVDLGTAQITTALQKQQEYFVSLHNQNKQAMSDELKKDPYFGANGDAGGQVKVKMELASFLQRNVPKPELTAFRNFVEEKGIGDSLALAKVINTLKQKIDKYENESAKMLPGTKPAPTKAPVGTQSVKGMQAIMYGKQA